jgi:hypothetical protein
LGMPEKWGDNHSLASSTSTFHARIYSSKLFPFPNILKFLYQKGHNYVLIKGTRCQCVWSCLDTNAQSPFLAQCVNIEVLNWAVLSQLRLIDSYYSLVFNFH